MGRRKNAAHKSARIPVTRGLLLRSRVPGNWHARFCSRGGGSDSLAYCNRIAARWRTLLNLKRRVWAARAEGGRSALRRSVVVAERERHAPSAHTLNPAAYLRRGGGQHEATEGRTEDL
jgi:hypothetical protein